MSDREITIQSSNLKKGKPDQRTFTCQLITIGNTKTYVLDDTKRDLLHMRFELAPGCKVEENGAHYRIQEIWYSPRPKYVFIAVYPDSVY